MTRNYELLTLIENKDYDKIFSLIRKGVNINEKIGRNTPLIIAVYSGEISIVELLLRNGANLQLPGTLHNPLHVAARYGHLDITKLLVKYGAVVDCLREKSVRAKCAIHFAAEEGHTHVVDYFLNKGVDIDVICYLGTPLHCAAMGKKTDMMKHLIEKGANINKENDNGRTALHTCALNYDAINTELLIQKGAHIKIFYKDDMNPLHRILNYKNNIEVSEPIAQILIKYMLLQSEISEINFSDYPLSYLQKRSAFVNDCKTEIEKMKIMCIGNTTVSLYTFLHDMFDDFMLAKRLKNKRIRDELENVEDLMKTYPIYSSAAVMVKDKLANWNERQDLLKTVYEIVNVAVFPLLPVEVMERIFDYLTNSDLITFGNACKNCLDI